MIRADWAAYLNSWVQTDLEVNTILKRLQHERLADNTIVFFWSDHGISHARGKQFLYDEGIRVPMIIRFPDGRAAGLVRNDLVNQLDIAASSLKLAGISIPDHVQGRDLFAETYRPREMISSARDRCDETVDIQRCVRTKRYKYIRNFLPHLPHLQPNRYKDSKHIIALLRGLHRAGGLDEIQSRLLSTARPPEELDDLRNDPHEIANLAQVLAYRDTLISLRTSLYDWMINSRDLGLIPEPILEEMGRRYGNKYRVLQPPENHSLTRELLRLIDSDELAPRLAGLASPQPAIRYWSASLLGVVGNRSFTDRIGLLTKDASSGVRVAAALALCRLGDPTASQLLADEVANENLSTGMYAIRGLELIGANAKPHLQIVRAARDNPYEFTRRIAVRLHTSLTGQERTAH